MNNYATSTSTSAEVSIYIEVGYTYGGSLGVSSGASSVSQLTDVTLDGSNPSFPAVVSGNVSFYNQTKDV